MPKGKDKKDFKLYKDMRSSFEKLSDEEAGKLIKHLFAYVCCENPTPPDRIIDISFEPIKQALERDLVKWKNTCIRNAENGSHGGRPSKTEKTQSVILKPKKADTDTDTDTDTKINKKESKERKVFKKPELSEVVQYFLNQEMPQGEAESFFDYYEANGWKVGRNPMRNWQAAVRNWKKNYKGYGKTVKLGTSEARIAAIKNF